VSERRAVEHLRELIGDDPAVTLVDVGTDPSDAPGAGDAVLRVHVRAAADIERLQRRGGLPAEVDGLRVVAMVARYDLDEG